MARTTRAVTTQGLGESRDEGLSHSIDLAGTDVHFPFAETPLAALRLQPVKLAPASSSASLSTATVPCQMNAIPWLVLPTMTEPLALTARALPGIPSDVGAAPLTQRTAISSHLQTMTVPPVLIALAPAQVVPVVHGKCTAPADVQRNAVAGSLVQLTIGRQRGNGRYPQRSTDDRNSVHCAQRASRSVQGLVPAPAKAFVFPQRSRTGLDAQSFPTPAAAGTLVLTSAVVLISALAYEYGMSAVQLGG